ncbi:hypothetical protein SAMN05444920_12524 [Nonomuraea solani]|uniref:Uncharacterized protein n=1 Tax=Nonomuraea solani TaxID=1144553 RepID=A0A1H6EWM2_9ACTN|nr:hypothetical protein [Nonomuraea solani]SEH02237.1 hypothetical protein SAMN05444920_12524 [Nonomuraea solani]
MTGDFQRADHLKSKGTCPAGGPDADQGDGQSCWNAARVSQAQALLGLIQDLDLPNPIVLGDLKGGPDRHP